MTRVPAPEPLGTASVRVEGGCNVQFACRPTRPTTPSSRSTRAYSRSSALASKATGYPIARVAAQIAVGAPAGRDPQRRDRHDRRRLRTGARLRRRQAAALPVRQVPGRRSDARVADEGDRRGDGDRRTFGPPSTRRCAVSSRRGRPAGRGSGLDVDLRLPCQGLRRRRRRTTMSPSAGSTKTGQACESTRHAQRTAAPDRASPLPRAVRFAPLAPARPAPPRRSGSRRRRGDRDLAWFLAEMGRNVALEREVARVGEGLADPTDIASAELLATTKRAGFGDKELAGLAGTTSDRCAGPDSRSPPTGLRDGRHLPAEFAAETPYFYSTYAAAGSEPEAPPVGARGGPSSSARGRSASAGDRVRTTARSRRRIRSAAPAGEP